MRVNIQRTVAQSLNGSTTEKTTEKILELIRTKPGITAENMASEIGITIDGINYHIRRLKDSGKIKRVGGKKEGYWEVVD